MKTVCIAGKNKIATEAATHLLEAQAHAGFKLICCVNQTDTGIDTWQPSLLRLAQKHNIPVMRVQELYDIEDIVFISLEFDKIIKPERFKSKRLYNIHFSNLPAYKGVYTSIMPIVNGEPEAGVTLHEIDPGIDTGNIISQRLFPIGENINGRDLYDLYLSNSIVLYHENINSILAGPPPSYIQPIKNSSYYSKKTLDFSNIVIDTNKTAWEIHNQIRAFSFRDYQLPTVNGEKIYRSEILPEKSILRPGITIHQDQQKVTISSIDFNIDLYIDHEATLFQACESGSIDQIRQLVVWKFPITIRNKKGWNALIVAAYHGQLELVKFLLYNGFSLSDTNFQGTTVAMYAMTYASKTDNLDILRLILSLQPDLSILDNKGRDIFSYADEYNNRKVLDLLKRYR